ncbi:MAG: hypothetical protein VCD16_00930 [Planctomycetota bacterium]
MKNLPEINHCSPNPEAWWCADCKAHNTFDIVSRKSSNGTTWLYNCKAGCGLMRMFNPGEVLPWKNGLFVFVGLSFLIAVPLGLIPLSNGEDINRSRPLQIAGILVGFGAFFGLIAWSMAHYLKKWSAWSSAQRRKSPEELRQEALDHPFQPEYDNSADFTEWAEQFLTPEEVERLHEKYGESEDGEKQEARIVLRVEGDPREPPPPAPGE